MTGPAHPSGGLPRRAVLAAAAAGVAPIAGLVAAPAAHATGQLGMIEARQRFFGRDNVHFRTGAVDPNKVIVSWFGVSSFALAIGGTVVLLDAWVPRGASSGYVPTSAAEVARLQPEAIFLGHGHFDHGGDAAFIAARSNAVVVGTEQMCRQVAAQAPSGTQIRTRPIGDASDQPGTRHDIVVAGIDLSVMTHVHSAPKPPQLGSPLQPLVLLPDVCSLVEDPTTVDALAHLGSHAADQQGGALLYQFRARDFAVTWHDSTGPIPEDAPGLVEDLRGLPATTLQIGALQGFNQYTNGLRDPRLYIEALRPEIFAPCHHDNWAPVFTTSGDEYRTALDREIERIDPAHRPEVRFLTDPHDYVRPDRLTFTIPPRRTHD